MPLSPRKSLQSRVILLVALGFLALAGTAGGYSFLAVRESTQRALHERLVLAQATADHLQYLLELNLGLLQDVPFAQGVDLNDQDPEPEKRALREFYLHSPFSDVAFLLDGRGSVLWTEPPHQSSSRTDMRDVSYVKSALEAGRPLISDVVILPSGQSVIATVSPWKDGTGRVQGLLGTEVYLAGPGLASLLRSVNLGQTGYIDIVDSKGVVLASTRPEHVLQPSDHGSRLADLIVSRSTTEGTCHSCHEVARQTEVMAFAPLPSTPWGVTIRQAEDEALAPARRLQRNLTALGAPLLALGLLLGWGTALSVLRPVRTLTATAQRIAQGNLNDPVPKLGEDELGRLAEILDQMRAKLRESLEQSRLWSLELESRVDERTRQVEESRHALESLYAELQRKDAARDDLLRKVMTAQEDERKRTARDLHDDISQTLAALVMAIDRAQASSPQEQDQLQKIRQMAVAALDGIHRAIFDLRPSMLDDLGLVAAVRWYAESRLHPLEIRTRIEVEGNERRLPSQIETALFRVAQEGITNVARHSNASDVVVTLQFRDEAISLEIEDDGQGFDVAGVTQDGIKGLGLLGMKERTELLGGTFQMNSAPGRGATLAARIPLSGGGHDGQGAFAAGR